MKIKRKVSQHRRDFIAIYQCDHCGHEQRGEGYDDAYFHQHVIPMMVCGKCEQTASPATPTSTPDVPAHVVI